MRPMRWSVRNILLIVTIFARVLFAAPVAAQVAECDDEYNVSRSGDVWRVSPNGVDDTANLECVLTESGGGATPPTLMLDSGVFHVDWL